MIELGSTLNNFQLKGIDGVDYNPGFYNEKKILVILFISADKYGRLYVSRLNQLKREFSVGFFAVSNDSIIDLERLNLEFPILLDPGYKFAQKMDAMWTPEALVFDKNRVLVYRGKIDDCWHDPLKVKKDYLRMVIKSLLKGAKVKAITHPEGRPIHISPSNK